MKFNVLLFPINVVRVTDIEADTVEEALEKAERIIAPTLANTEDEWTEEFHRASIYRVIDGEEEEDSFADVFNSPIRGWIDWKDVRREDIG